MNAQDKLVKRHARDDRVVEVLRDSDGKLYSQVREHPAGRMTNGVVIDRQHGYGKKGYGEDFVKNRAQALAKLLEIEYVEDLRWPCRALELTGECRCPECSSKRAANIGVRHTRPIEP
jgi:hypothetical protein